MMTLRLLIWCNIVIMCCISCLKLYNLVYACTTNATILPCGLVMYVPWVCCSRLEQDLILLLWLHSASSCDMNLLCWGLDCFRCTRDKISFILQANCFMIVSLESDVLGSG